jgi:hypothetical protein
LQTSGDQLYPTKGHDASHPLVLTQTVHSYQNIHVLLEHQPVYMWCSTVSSTSLPCLRVILVRLQTFLLCGFFTMPGFLTRATRQTFLGGIRVHLLSLAV